MINVMCIVAWPWPTTLAVLDKLSCTYFWSWCHCHMSANYGHPQQWVKKKLPPGKC